MKKLVALLMALMMLFSFALAEETATATDTTTDTTEEDTVIALVNGEELMNSTYTQVKNDYLTAYTQMGYDITDEAKKAYVEDLALTAAIQNLLVDQDMRAQGCYDFTEEIENWCTEQGKAAYESAIENVKTTLNDTLELDGDDADNALNVYGLCGTAGRDRAGLHRRLPHPVRYHALLRLADSGLPRDGRRCADRV